MRTLQKLIEIVRKPTLQEVALRELAEAEREALLAESAIEFSRATLSYNRKRAERLRKFTAVTEREPVC